MPLSSRLKIDLSFGVALLILAVIAFLSYRSVVELRRDGDRVGHAEEVLRVLGETASHLTEAETGQRGFLLTRQDRFLAPYTAAVALLGGDLERLDSLVTEPEQVARVRRLEALARRRMAITSETVRLGREGRFDEAVAIVAGGVGNGLMDEIRGVVREMGAREYDRLATHQRQMAATARRTIGAVLLAGFLAVLVVTASRGRMQAELRARESVERTLARNAAATRALYDIAASREQGFGGKLGALLEMGCEHFGLDIGLLARFDVDGQRVVQARDPAASVKVGDIVATDDGGVRVGHPDAFLGAPVLVNGGPYGTLCFSNARPRAHPFSDEERGFLRLIAQWVGGEVERREAEDAIRESEQRYRRLTEASLEGIVVTDQGRIVDANLAFGRDFRMPVAELIGRDMLDVTAPESRELVARYVQSGFEEPYELVALRPDGSRFHMEARGKATTYRGRPARVTAVRDITERKHAEEVIRESEERFRSLVEAASDIIYRTDLEGHFTYVNPTSVQIMGFPAERLLGMRYLELIREDAREAAHAFYSDQIDRGERSSYYEFPAVTAEGREVWIGQNVRLLYEVDELVGIQAVARDITRQREVEALKEEFLSVVSHELRTPLTAIRGSLGLLASGRMGTLEERGQRMLEIAAQNTDRLVRLINDLLDIEKIESGEASMERQRVEARELMERAAEAMSSVAEKAGVRLVVEPLEATLSADPDRLDQVLTNLLSNAIKFSPEGSTVTLAGELRGEQAVFRVHDTGRGIPADKLELIFERFQQVDSSDARQKGGTGLGLSIARSIVRQHGGEVWVESRWGAGSTFYFSLPALTAPRTAPEDDRPLLLVCDDDPGVRALVRAYLEREDYRVRVVGSGEETLAAARELHPAAILLDLRLPGMSGAEVLRRLRAQPETRRTPVVVLTGAGEDADLDPAEIVGWVEKPIDRETLVTTVRWATSQKQEHFHVLVVEDSDDVAGVVTEMLRHRGVKTFRARTGREAIDLSRRISYDLLLLEPGLPDVDGFGLVDWLRRHNRHRNVPVMVYTARELDESERERLRLGPTEFVVKTRVTPEELERRIVARLDRMISAGRTMER